MANSIDQMQLQGDARRHALHVCAQQLSLWDVASPRVEPLVMDFGLDDFARTGLIEYWIANEIAPGYCGKYLFVLDGQSCPAHSHARKHETFFLVKGRLRVTVDGQARVLEPGDSLAIAPGIVHSFAGVGPALLLELSMPCLVDDNHFKDPKIAAWLRSCLQ